MERNGYNVFISWSGERSKRVAEAIYRWLPPVVQSVRPWMSASDIDKGARNLTEITRALDGIKVGIVCLTPENLTAPWILYESGALSKTVDRRTRLYTLLLGGLKPQDVSLPLGLFQATQPTKAEMAALVQSINRAVSANPVPDSVLQTAFDHGWAELESALKPFPSDAAATPPRSSEDMIAEILAHVRTLSTESTVVDDPWSLQSNYYKASPEAWDDRWKYTVRVNGRDKPFEHVGRAALELRPGVIEIMNPDDTFTRFEGVEEWSQVQLSSGVPFHLRS